MILLLQPPVAKPCEPPAGIARLSGFLTNHGITHRVVDANVEGLISLLGLKKSPESGADTWTRRAFRNREKHLLSLRGKSLYRNHSRYSKAVKDLSRILSFATGPDISIGLADYGHRQFSPLRSGDLLFAAEHPHLDPFFHYFKERLRALFSDGSVSFVGISLNYLSQALTSFAMAGFIRHELPDVKIVLGGGLVTSWMRNLKARNPFAGLIDDLVAGPGEPHLSRILGLENGPIKFPKPSYLDFPGEQYLSPGFILPYAASSGCYWNKCDFCPEKAEGNAWLQIPADQVVSDLGELGEETHPELVHFLDNAMSPALLEKLSLQPCGIPWYGFARTGKHLTDPGFCADLKKSGCVMLKLGIESGDQGVLDAMDKGISIERASSVLRTLKQAGIAAYVYLLFGTPSENQTAARKTLEFAVQHSDCIDFLNLAIFNLPIGAACSSGLEVRQFSEGDLSLYTDFRHPHEWDRKRVRLFLEREFKVHPAIAPILKNDPPVFTSNHAPFFVSKG